MIQQIKRTNIQECVCVIRESFLTVAEEFGFTMENAPRFTAFATTEERLYWQFDNNRPMFACFSHEKIIGYYSLDIKANEICELNNLCVLPEYRHKSVGSRLLQDAFSRAKEYGCKKLSIGIVEENKILRNWYEKKGFVHIGTQKFDFFPFTCGYMEKEVGTGMLPSIETAEKELRIAGEQNPGPWIEHSVNTGIAARSIAAKIQGMDSEKAYILGLLHDIGRRVGVVNIPKHVYEGYLYASSKGWNDVARICMTHSYPLMDKEFDYEPENREESEIKKYISGCKCDDYDLLIQLCDSLAVDYGFCILEKRFVDVARRYGVWKNTVERWNAKFAIKEYFDEKMGSSVYDVLPDIGRTTLLCFPLWKPPIN